MLLGEFMLDLELDVRGSTTVMRRKSPPNFNRRDKKWKGQKGGHLSTIEAINLTFADF